MNKAIGRVFYVGVALFVAVILNLTWLQVIRADHLAEQPENRRQLAKELRIKRGSILAFDGSVIARSVRRSGFYQRRYPNGTLAPQMIGYDTVRYGRSGVEQEMNDELLGKASELGVQNWLDQLLGRRPTGADVVTTLVPDVQTRRPAGARRQEGSDRRPRPRHRGRDRRTPRLRATGRARSRRTGTA